MSSGSRDGAGLPSLPGRRPVDGASSLGRPRRPLGLVSGLRRRACTMVVIVATRGRPRTSCPSKPGSGRWPSPRRVGRRPSRRSRRRRRRPRSGRSSRRLRIEEPTMYWVSGASSIVSSGSLGGRRGQGERVDQSVRGRRRKGRARTSHSPRCTIRRRRRVRTYAPGAIDPTDRAPPVSRDRGSGDGVDGLDVDPRSAPASSPSTWSADLEDAEKHSAEATRREPIAPSCSIA